MEKTLFPGYTIGPDAYDDIAAVCPAYGKKAAVIGGKRALAAAGDAIVKAARAAGIEAYDTPFTDTRDLEGLEQDALFAKGLGFTGKACISPAHVSTVNRVFSPTQAEIAYAKDVFAAIAEAKRLGKGAISLRGKMIDAPIVLRARLVLEAASEIEGVDYLA